MMNRSGISAFLATVEAGSISGASKRLGLATSVVSERLAELEKSLGAKLIQRTTRKLSLTESGLSFIPRAQRIMRKPAAGEAETPDGSGTLAGTLPTSHPGTSGGRT